MDRGKGGSVHRVIVAPPACVGPDAPLRTVEQLVERLGSPVSLAMPFGLVHEDDPVVLTAAPSEAAP